MEFLTDNKIQNVTATSEDGLFPSTAIAVRRLNEAYRTDDLSAGDNVTVNFEADDWEGFDADVSSEAQAELVGRYKCDEEVNFTGSPLNYGVIADSSDTGLDVGFFGGMADAGPTNSRWITAAEGPFTGSLTSHKQSLVRRSDKCWWLSEQKAFYTFELENGKSANSSDSGVSTNLTDNGTITYGAGPHGNFAATYDGSTGYHSRAAWFAPGTDSFSIGFWFNLTSADGILIEQRGGASPYEGFYIYCDSSRNIRASIADGSAASLLTVISSSDISLDTWHHVVVCYNRETGYVIGFLDGVEKTSGYFGATVTGSISASGSFNIGTGVITPTLYLDGSLSNVRIIQAALSADDAAELYAVECKGDLDEETYVHGDLSETQTAAFHGGGTNWLTNGDLTDFTLAQCTKSDYNDNYYGHKYEKITATDADSYVYDRHVTSAGYALFSGIIKNIDSAQTNILTYITSGTANISIVQIVWATQTVTVSGSSYLLNPDDLIEWLDTDTLKFKVIRLTTATTHTFRIDGDQLSTDKSILVTALSAVDNCTAFLPFFTGTKSARNITGIEFYPRDGMVIDVVCENLNFATATEIGYIIANTNGASLTPSNRLFMQTNTRLLGFSVSDDSGTTVTMPITVPSNYLHLPCRIVVIADITSQTTGIITIYYNYNIVTGSYEDSDTANWNADPVSVGFSSESLPMSIGTDGAGTASRQWKGNIYSLEISHPDDPSYYYRWDGLRPFGDYVERKDAFDGAPFLRHVYLWDEFKRAAVLDALDTCPEGVANPATRLALLNHNLTGYDTVTLKASTGIHPIEIQDVPVDLTDPYYLQLTTSIARFTTAALEITAGRDGYRQIGWMFLGEPLEIPDPNAGVVPQYTDNDVLTLSMGRQLYIDRGIHAEYAEFQISVVNTAEWEAFREYWEGVMRHLPGLFVQTPDDLTRCHPFFAILRGYDQQGRERPREYPRKISFEEVY